ncbi:MAG: DNA-binding protein [Euryarchaeota archaeon]|nr:DNA-binding protein [Euryarchaeota archaeon]
MIEREVAHRIFAKEFNDSKFNIRSDVDGNSRQDAHTPHYIVTPAGAKLNRLFVVGVVTEVDNVGTEKDMWKARVVDPSGAFTVYAGQYQPEAAIFMSTIELPSYVAIVGKVRMYEPDDGSVFVSIRPEEINAVDARTRNRWVVDTAEITLDRVEAFSKVIAECESSSEVMEYMGSQGMPVSLAEGISLAMEYYHTDETYLGNIRKIVKDCLQSLGDGLCEGVGAEEDVEDRILDMLVDMNSGKGVDYMELIKAASAQDLSEGAVDVAVRSLLAKGHCYEPKIGILKPVQ